MCGVIRLASYGYPINPVPFAKQTLEMPTLLKTKWPYMCGSVWEFVPLIYCPALDQRHLQFCELHTKWKSSSSLSFLFFHCHKVAVCCNVNTLGFEINHTSIWLFQLLNLLSVLLGNVMKTLCFRICEWTYGKQGNPYLGILALV